MHSHHSHSGSFCTHATGDLEAVVQEAIRQGFTVYGLSEHVPRYRDRDLYPGEESIGLERLSELFTDFLAEAHRLKLKYREQITLLVGLETEFISDVDLERLEALLSFHPNKIEYLVGSVHHVNHVPIDFDKETWIRAVNSLPRSESVNDAGSGEGTLMPPPKGDATSDSTRLPFTPATLSTYFHSYFDAQLTLLKRFHPEIIGHFDLCRLYVRSVRLDDPTEYPGLWEKVQRNVDYAVGYGACFEANAAAFRKGWGTSYPGEEVLKLILSRGGRIVLSDDSHGPQAVGGNYRRLFDYLVGVDVKELWYLERCDEANAGGRKVRPKKYDGEWKSDSWWASLQ
ncbi:histidinolphosphatase [Tulasnella sp. 403]|nr:histidinolphosphatase [Tulasnella sp. 403]